MPTNTQSKHAVFIKRIDKERNHRLASHTSQSPDGSTTQVFENAEINFFEGRPARPSSIDGTKADFKRLIVDIKDLYGMARHASQTSCSSMEMVRNSLVRISELERKLLQLTQTVERSLWNEADSEFIMDHQPSTEEEDDPMSADDDREFSIPATPATRMESFPQK